MTLSRRDFVKVGIQGGLGTLLIPAFSPVVAAGDFLQNTGTPEDPHFFLQIVIQGGLDSSYTFDARPVEMFTAGKIQNYCKDKVPVLWNGKNGDTTWVSKLAHQRLNPFRDDFSIINGVQMAPGGFDGHDQQLNYLLTGSPFGGEYFMPHLNQSLSRALPPRPLDGLQTGQFFGAQLQNTSRIVPLTPDSAIKLVNRLKTSTPLSPASSLFKFIQSRYFANSQSGGSFSRGSKALAEGLDSADVLSNLLKELQVPQVPGMDAEERFIRMAFDLFRLKATRSAVLAIGPSINTAKGNFNVDTHDPDSARRQPEMVDYVLSKLELILRLLKETEYTRGRSFLEVTTVVFCSEFGRTMRKIGSEIDQTGTDHNGLTNTVLLGGKGIRSGQIVGGSDFQTSTEILSEAHLSHDKQKIKVVGRPFDFKTQKPRLDLPTTYNPEDYLNFASVANTVYELFQVSDIHHRTILRQQGAPVAPSLKGLLFT